VSRHRRRGPLMELERGHEPLLPYPTFLRRLVRSVLAGASMILGGMGPVDDRGLGIPAAEKWFASAYALFAGMALLVVVGVMFAPLFHRFLHHFHLVEEEEKQAR
jgi:hypothetical protein